MTNTWKLSPTIYQSCKFLSLYWNIHLMVLSILLKDLDYDIVELDALLSILLILFLIVVGGWCLSLTWGRTFCLILIPPLRKFKFPLEGHILLRWPHPLHLKHCMGLCPSVNGPEAFVVGPAEFLESLLSLFWFLFPLLLWFHESFWWFGFPFTFLSIGGLFFLGKVPPSLLLPTLSLDPLIHSDFLFLEKAFLYQPPLP